MAIGTYAELQTAVANWLDRSDLTDHIPEFISLFEARFLRTAQLRRMEKRATANTVASQRALAVPTDYERIRSIKLNRDTVDVLEYLSPSVLYEGSSSTGVPKYYTIQGSQLILEPIPDGSYEVELNYYAFTPLSDSNTTNWLLTDYPDIYLYGSLLGGETYILRDERVPMWKSALDEALKELEKEDKKSRWGDSPLVIRAQA